MAGAIFGVGMMCVLQINRVNKGYYLESKMEKGEQDHEN